ncbi:TrgA family protein [Pseudooceanicola sp.]|uniref:TrgA family protein n=1 Tax=Pseudooceanicola sp. TaxID=1914328 RepID=UPI0035C6E2A4
MPTAARIVAAACIGFIAWVVSGLIKLQMPDQANFGYFVPICVVVGILCGWVILGRRADRGRLGYSSAIGVGLSAMAMTVFWVLLMVSAWESFDVAMSRRFHDPMKVIYNLYPIGSEHLMTMKDTAIIVWLVAGGAITGILAHMAGQKWPGR